MESKLIPNLRFPEFLGEWTELKLSKITSKIGSGKTPKGGEEVYVKGGIPFIRSQNVTGNRLELDSTHIPESVHEEMKSSKVYSNDILLNITGGSIGRSCVVPEKFDEGNVNQHVCIIRLDNFNPNFLQPYLTSWRGQKLVFQGQTGSGREGLNFESIKGFKIAFPKIKEQTRIANFLTSVDKRINLLQKKKAQLEQYKKGVMQKLFSQAIRFKDENGNDYPDWEEKKLGEVVEFVNTNSFSRSYLNYKSGNVKNIHYGDIHTRYSANFDISKEHVPYVNENIDLSKIKDTQYCKEGDLIIADASEDYKDIGKAIEVIKLDGQSLIAGLHTYIARDKTQVAIGFKAYLMQCYYVRKQIMRLATGISVLGISKTNLSEIKISIPIFPEQQKIASFLSSIDKKIEKTAQQIEASQQWKKGLLQKMFV